MPAKLHENWDLSYNASDPEAGHDVVRNVNVSWQNRPLDEIKSNLNTFLRAVGVHLEVVDLQAGT